jgi:glycosyltransferase involved in cell wall biosynthesis
MKRKVLFFSHTCPYPINTGVDRRNLDILKALKDLGCEIYFLSTDLHAGKPWNDERAQKLKDDFVREVQVYHVSKSVEWVKNVIEGVRNCIGFPMNMKTVKEFDSEVKTIPGIRPWFHQQSDRISPDVILMVYTSWHELLRENETALKIIETSDMLSLNSKMQEAVGRYIAKPLRDANQVAPEVLDEMFYKRLNLLPDARELQTFDKFDYTIAISPSEAEMVQKNTNRTKVVYIPVTFEVKQVQNEYADAALFPTGPNRFNLQGLYYFLARVLPNLRSHCPDFQLKVTGKFCSEVVDPVPNVELMGHVTDEALRSLYEKSRFLVNPVFGGTGQTVKVVEAMAHGLPVVLLEEALPRAPIVKHGINGFVAKNDAEFARFVAQLWRDRDLCAQMGEEARRSVTRELTHSRLRQELEKMLG